MNILLTQMLLPTMMLHIRRGANARALANQSSFSLGNEDVGASTSNDGSLSARGQRNANSQTQQEQPLNRYGIL